MHKIFLILGTLGILLSFQETKATPINSAKINSVSSKMKAHVFRLKPGQDFMVEITNWAKANHIKAASIVSVVGSFKKITLRYANQPNTTTQEGFFEIVSLVGTFNEDSAHLHASVSNGKGETFGGHLSKGNIIFTTAEVIVAELDDAVFSREHDSESGWDELVVRNKK